LFKLFYKWVNSIKLKLGLKIPKIAKNYT